MKLYKNIISSEGTSLISYQWHWVHLSNIFYHFLTLYSQIITYKSQKNSELIKQADTTIENTTFAKDWASSIILQDACALPFNNACVISLHKKKKKRMMVITKALLQAAKLTTSGFLPQELSKHPSVRNRTRQLKKWFYLEDMDKVVRRGRRNDKLNSQIKISDEWRLCILW